MATLHQSKFEEYFVVMGRFLSVKGSCDRCSITNSKFWAQKLYKINCWRIFDVMRLHQLHQTAILVKEQNRWKQDRWTPTVHSWALPWTPSWDVSWGVLEGLNTGKSALINALVGALVGGLVGPLVDPLVGPLVGSLVGQISLSPVLCVVHIRFKMITDRLKSVCN